MQSCQVIIGLEFRANLLDREQPAIGVLDGEHGVLPTLTGAGKLRVHFRHAGRKNLIFHDLHTLGRPANTKCIAHMARREVRLAFLGDSRQDTFAAFRSHFASDAFYTGLSCRL